MRLAEIAPERDERLFVCGQTGTGKTFLVERIVRAHLYPYVVINDAKGEMFGPAGYPGGELVTSLKAMERSRSPVIHLRLPLKEQSDEAWTRFYYFCFDRGHTMVVTDELSMVMDGYHPPEGFRACACQGRSRGVGMISCSQRPASIPVVARSEAQRYICFELALRDDRKAVGEFMSEDVVSKPASGHHFYYYSKHERRLHYLTLRDTQGGT